MRRLSVWTVDVVLVFAASRAAASTSGGGLQRRDIPWRSAKLHLSVPRSELDILGARLRLDVDIHRTGEGSQVYVLCRVGAEGPWRRLDLSQPVVPVSSLGEGEHVVQLQAVEDGIIYQARPTEVPFAIRREKERVRATLAEMLTSNRPDSEYLAVEFLSFHLEPYLNQLRPEVLDDDRALFLLEAAEDRAAYGGTLKPEVPKTQYLVREVQGCQVYDFSRFPSLNPWYSKEMLDGSESLSGARQLYYDGEHLWFACRAGAGALDPDTGAVRLYGSDRGLAASVGAIRKALAGELFVGTDRGMARYEPHLDRFLHVPMEQERKLHVTGMAVDRRGRLWTVSTEYGGGVGCWDGKDWWHYGDHHLYGITRDDQGQVWVGGMAEQGDTRWGSPFPAHVLEKGGRLISDARERYFGDYLGRLFVMPDHYALEAGIRAWPESGVSEPQQIAAVRGKPLLDQTNRELWLVEGETLVNDTRRSDPLIPERSRLTIPAPPGESESWNSICLVAEDRVFLGAKAGLYRFDGESWQKVKVGAGKAASAERTWPSWHVRTSSDAPLYNRVSATRIEIMHPFPGSQAPAGRVYEIVKRKLDYYLVETLPGGEAREYRFRPPFRYGPDALFCDYNGYVWAIGTHYAYWFNGEGIETFASKNTAHMPNDHIYSFAADKHGDVWIGTESGICLFSGGGFVEPPHQIPGTVSAMAYDAETDMLVLSSSWNGFYVKAGEAWTHYRIPFGGHGRHDQHVRSITLGPDGSLWLATNAGLVSFSKDRSRWVKYGNEHTAGVVLNDSQTMFVEAAPPYMLRLLNGPKVDPGGQEQAEPQAVGRGE